MDEVRTVRFEGKHSISFFIDHCVVFKSAVQFWKNVTGRYDKYASDHAFGTSLANKLAYL